MAESLIDRFYAYCLADVTRRMESKWTPEPNTGCWLWFGSADDKGYGRLNFCGGPVLAHRLSYELEIGPIPEGLVLDHKCRMPACVNPAHLEPVTMAENTRRGIAGQLSRERSLALTHCKRGHPLSGANMIISKWNGQRICLACRLVRKRAYNAKLPKKGRNLEGLKLGGAANAARNLAKTHCPHGHEYAGRNLIIGSYTGGRECRACRNARQSARNKRKRQ